VIYGKCSTCKLKIPLYCPSVFYGTVEQRKSKAASDLYRLIDFCPTCKADCLRLPYEMNDVCETCPNLVKCLTACI
jgi:hypothetical protein